MNYLAVNFHNSLALVKLTGLGFLVFSRSRKRKKIPVLSRQTLECVRCYRIRGPPVGLMLFSGFYPNSEILRMHLEREKRVRESRCLRRFPCDFTLSVSVDCYFFSVAGATCAMHLPKTRFLFQQSTVP